MKRLMLGLFFVFLFVFLIGDAGAQSSCVDDQRIMRLSATNNAHGEVYNGAGNYQTEICYKDVFGRDYNGPRAGNRVHDCNPTTAPNNVVLRLSNQNGDINAHAETPEGNSGNYFDVCYGDLSCQSINGDLDCTTVSNNHKEVVSLSKNTNAHLEKKDSNTYEKPENKKICCSSGSSSTGPTIDRLEWRYYDGTPIHAGARVCPNIYIIASAKTSALPDGTNGGFQIYKSAILIDKVIYNNISATVSNNQMNVTINLTNPGIRAYLKTFLGSSPDIEIYFKANATKPDGKELKSLVDSPIINYYDDISRCDYPKPTPVIKAPVHKGVYFIRTDISFESGCSSKMGPVKTEWTITQGENKFTDFRGMFLYKFTKAGQANVKLKCTDLAGRSTVNETQILIVEDSHVTLAYINKPGFDGFVVNPVPPSGPYLPQIVDFSASDSFVVKISNLCNVDCLGGDCPKKTQNSPSSCDSANPGRPLDITGAPDPGRADYSGMKFNWTFRSKEWIDHWTSFEGAGVYAGKTPYNDLSNAINDKFMSVNVTHTASGKDAIFERQFTLGRCLNNGNTYYDSIKGPLSTNLENNACKGEDVSSSKDDCCPTGFKCVSGASNNNFCQAPAGGKLKTRCEDFDNENDCNSNTDSKIPRASFGGNVSTCTFLECYWDTTQKCGVRATKYDQNRTGCDTGGGGERCGYVASTSECNGKFRTITYVKSSNNGPDCSDKPDIQVPCGALSFELSFFGIREFVISIILIASIYLIINFYRIKRE